MPQDTAAGAPLKVPPSVCQSCHVCSSCHLWANWPSAPAANPSSRAGPHEATAGDEVIGPPRSSHPCHCLVIGDSRTFVRDPAGCTDGPLGPPCCNRQEKS